MDSTLPGLNGMDALSESLTVNGTDGEGCGEGNGEGEMGWVVAKLRSSLAPREVGMGGWGPYRRGWFGNR